MSMTEKSCINADFLRSLTQPVQTGLDLIGIPVGQQNPLSFTLPHTLARGAASGVTVSGHINNRNFQYFTEQVRVGTAISQMYESIDSLTAGVCDKSAVNIAMGI